MAALLLEALDLGSSPDAARRHDRLPSCFEARHDGGCPIARTLILGLPECKVAASIAPVQRDLDGPPRAGRAIGPAESLQASRGRRGDHELQRRSPLEPPALPMPEHDVLARPSRSARAAVHRRAALATIFLVGCRASAPSRLGSEHAVSGGTVFERRLDGDPERPTIVLLHGVPVTSSVNEPFARVLRARVANPVSLVDLPGLGRSTVAGNVCWSTQRAVLGAWLREQGAVILVVHDIAGPIALPLLADDRIDVRGVVLLNTILEPSTFRPVASMRLLRAPALGLLLAQSTPRWFILRRMHAIGIGRPERVDTVLLERIFAEAFGGDGSRKLHAVLRGFELDPATDRAIAEGLAQCDAPCVAVWADEDPSLGSERRHLLALAPHCPVHVLPGARHFLMLDHPSEIADALIAAGIERW